MSPEFLALMVIGVSLVVAYRAGRKLFRRDQR